MRVATAVAVSQVLVGVSQASLYPGQSKLNHTCQLQTPFLSCSTHAQANLTDSCCTETYGGLVLSTQFWSTYTGLESEGQVLPKESWTLHGLWPDFCDGSYTQYCDLKRQYDPKPSPNTTTGKPDGAPVKPYHGPNVSKLLAPFGKLDLFAYMNKFWINQGSSNDELWAHEFSKHATCFSTFDLPCYGPSYKKHEELVDYYSTSVAYFQNLPTWGWLSAGDIRPSNVSQYSLTDMQSALTKGFGATPYIGCSGPKYNETEGGSGSADNGRTVVSEVWYYYHVYGQVQRNQGLPVDANINGGSVSNCAKVKGALQYPLRGKGSEI